MSQIEIYGELFNVETEDGHVYVTHPRWSLVGMGKTLFGAEMSLIAEAKIIYHSFCDAPPKQVSPNWLDLMDYCQRLTAVKTVRRHV
jgi:hypothetical protein